MADVLRSCSKTACRWPAAASLSYRYATRQVWLLDLAPAPDPALYDLCPHHADNLVVPRGWERVDDRHELQVMVEPSADDRAVAAARRHAAGEDPDPTPRRQPLVGAVAGRNRYAELVEQLPRLAAESAESGAATIRSGPVPADLGGAPTAQTEPVAPAPPPARPAPAHPAGQGRIHSRPAPPVPSRELAPLPAPGAAWDPDDDRPLPGQLAIPVDDADGEENAVVVPFSSAGARRRRP